MTHLPGMLWEYGRLTILEQQQNIRVMSALHHACVSTNPVRCPCKALLAIDRLGLPTFWWNCTTHQHVPRDSGSHLHKGPPQDAVGHIGKPEGLKMPAQMDSCIAIHSFIHYTPSNPQIRCVAADILWQPSSLPCLGRVSTM